MAKILLAEDDLFLRDIYTEVLKDADFDVTSAVDGEEALNKLKEGGWDLVLLDVIMPKLTGVEVLKHIRGTVSHQYARFIVFMTNMEETKEMSEVMDMIDGFFMKSSITPDQLVDKVKNFLNK